MRYQTSISRSFITLNKLNGALLHDGQKCSFRLSKNNIIVGCSCITPEALYFIVEQYEKHFKKEQEEIIVQ